VRESNPSEKQFQEWILREFPSLKSRRVVKDRVGTIENLGLIIRSGDGGFTLSDEGEQFLRTHDKKILYGMLDMRYVGVHEVLELLQEKPSTPNEIASFIENKTGVKWQTLAPCSLRLGWLQGLGYVTKTGRHFSLSEEGRSIVEKEKEMIVEHPTHSEIKDRIAETGKLLGLLSEKEYKVDKYVLDVVWKEIEEGDPAFVFEVLLEGNLSDALVKLKYARSRFGRPELYLVTDLRYMSKASNVIRTSFREMAHAVRVIHWKDIDEFKETGNKFLETARRMKLVPKVILKRRKRATCRQPKGRSIDEKCHRQVDVGGEQRRGSKIKRACRFVRV
jgi:DNA-binding PadR family transcriptional regulator